MSDAISSKSTNFLLLTDRLSPDVARNAWNWLMNRQYIIKAVSRSTLVQKRPQNAPPTWTALDELKWDSKKVAPYHELLTISKKNFSKVALKILSAEIGVTAIPEIPWDQTSKELLVRSLDDVVPLSLPNLLNREALEKTVPSQSSKVDQEFLKWQEALIPACSSALKMVFPDEFSSMSVLEELDWPLTHYDKDTKKWFKGNTEITNPSQNDIDDFNEFVNLYEKTPESLNGDSSFVKDRTGPAIFANDNEKAFWQEKMKFAFADGLIENELNQSLDLIQNHKIEKGSIWSLMWRRSKLLKRLFPSDHQHQVILSEDHLYLWDRQPIDRWVHDIDKFQKTFVRWLFAILGIAVYYRNEIFPNADLLDEWPDSSFSQSRRAIFLIWSEGSWNWFILKRLSPFPNRTLDDTWKKCTELIYHQNDSPAIKSRKEFTESWLKNFSLPSLPRIKNLPTSATRLFLSFSDARAPAGTTNPFPWIELIDLLYMDQTEKFLKLLPPLLTTSTSDSSLVERWDIDAKEFLIDFLILASFDVYLTRKGSFGTTTPIYLAGEPLDLALANNLWLLKSQPIIDILKQKFLNDKKHYFLRLFYFNAFPDANQTNIDPVSVDFSIKSLLQYSKNPKNPTISRMQFRKSNIVIE